MNNIIREKSPKSHFSPGFDPYAEPDGHLPNHFSLKSRIFNGVMATALFSYGTAGVFFDNLYVPGKRGDGLCLHGLSAWTMYGAIISAACIYTSILLDHYDRRHNEKAYVQFRDVAKWIGWILFVLGFVLEIRASRK